MNSRHEQIARHQCPNADAPGQRALSDSQTRRRPRRSHQATTPKRCGERVPSYPRPARPSPQQAPRFSAPTRVCALGQQRSALGTDIAAVGRRDRVAPGAGSGRDRCPDRVRLKTPRLARSRHRALAGRELWAGSRMRDQVRHLALSWGRGGYDFLPIPSHLRIFAKRPDTGASLRRFAGRFATLSDAVDATAAGSAGDGASRASSADPSRNRFTRSGARSRCR
jgi:hypothetical protein